jgi:lipopolysaccharide export system protein LptC
MLGRLLATKINSSRQWISLGIGGIALLVYLTLWQEGTPPQLDEWIENEEGDEAPDAHIDTLTTRQFGESGALQYQITSPRAVHYPKNDVTHLQTPVFDYADEKSHWRGTALEGHLFNSLDTMLLSKNVVLQQLTQSAKLSTNALLVRIDQKLAVTAEPVTIESEGSTMKGVGLVADFNKQTLRLESHVEGVYEKRPR